MPEMQQSASNLILSKSELERLIEKVGNNFFCQNPGANLKKAIEQAMPEKAVSLIDYSEEYRKFKKGDGTLTRWNKKGRAALLPIMRAHDNPKFKEIVVPKPSRIGGTVIAECYVLKMMHVGPKGRALWYHSDPEGYAQKEFKDLFDRGVHPIPLARLGRNASDDKLTFKRFGPQYVELMKIGKKTTASREGEYIVMDEVDSYSGGWQFRFIDAARQRQAQIGNAAKRFFLSHPDVGWIGGISQAWVESSQGILVAACPDCGKWASAYPTKHWPDVPRYSLQYTKLPEGSSAADRISAAKKTASIMCPHCGSCMGEEQRAIMADTCIDMHRGQILDIEAGVIGEPEANDRFGLWLHIFFSTQVPLSELAERIEGAIEHFQRTGKTDKIRDAYARALGELFEGASSIDGLSSQSLKDRTKKMANAAKGDGGMLYSMGQVPDEVRFLTLQIDVGGGKKPGQGGKFDYLVTGWDLDRRRYIIDRGVRKYRMHGDVAKPIFPTMVQADWSVLEPLIDSHYSFVNKPDVALPIAVTVIDIKDGNATSFGVEFLRRMARKTWLGWPKVRGIMGAKSPDAPEVAPSVKDYNIGNDGSKIEPKIIVHNVGSSKLKEDVLATLAVANGAAGQWYFPVDFPNAYYEEIFNEIQVERTWVRNGDNETLDLGGYAEAARQIISPENTAVKPRDWTSGKEPVWARPVSLTTIEEGGDLAVAGEVQAVKPKTDYAAMLQGMDRG